MKISGVRPGALITSSERFGIACAFTHAVKRDTAASACPLVRCSESNMGDWFGMRLRRQGARREAQVAAAGA